ncbi:hypothetical protein J6590_107953, partial [Homalodisca vitripennis]
SCVFHKICQTQQLVNLRAESSQQLNQLVNNISTCLFFNKIGRTQQVVNLRAESSKPVNQLAANVST